RGYFCDLLWDIEFMDAIVPAGSNMFFVKPSASVKSNFILQLKLADLKYDTAEVNPLEAARDPKRFRIDVDEDILSKFFLSIKSSSISCERAFSICSRIYINEL
ncbi:MAG: hypothetical protein MHPSP_004823, partial [Paramarteilia canceri]